MASQPQQQRRQGVRAFILTTPLKLGKVEGNWDHKLLLPSLDPGWTPEKRMRSGLQKHHRLWKGKACQAMFPWCFSITSLGLVFHLLKPRRDTRELHKQWILKKCMHFTLSCWKIPMCQGAALRRVIIPHSSCLLSLLSPTTRSCLKNWSLFLSLCLARDITKGNKESFQLSVDLRYFNNLSCYTEVCLIQERLRITQCPELQHSLAMTPVLLKCMFVACSSQWKRLKKTPKVLSACPSPLTLVSSCLL